VNRTRNHVELGAEGESRAAQYLRRRGYRIVARNVRADRVEIDVIARRGPLLVFVEVKTRTSRHFGSGEEAVDARKQARLLRGASAWLRENRRGARRVRFDVIVVEHERGARDPWRVRHLEGAFDAGDASPY
jgi:putative endonuclease